MDERWTDGWMDGCWLPGCLLRQSQIAHSSESCSGSLTGCHWELPPFTPMTMEEPSVFSPLSPPAVWSHYLARLFSVPCLHR